MSITYLSLVSLFVLFMLGCNSHEEVQIVKDIGLKPASDVTSDRGLQVHRELIYLNSDKDPEFFSKIVGRVEQSSTITNLNCTKKPGRDMHGESLKQNGFSDDQIKESVIFRSEDSRFHCSISDGGEFVIVIIYTT